MDILAGLPPYTFTITIGLFLLINLFVGLYQGRHLNSLRSYALADKSMGTGTLTITIIATVVGGQYVTGLITSSQKMESGVSPFLVDITLVPICILLLSTYVFPRLLELKECYTLGDIMGKLYGKHAQIFTGTISIITSLVLLSAQLITVGTICQVLNINKTIVIIAIGVIVTLYTSLGGIRSVAATDIVQFICVVLGFLFIAYRVFQLDDGTGEPIGSVQRLLIILQEDYGNTHFRIWSHPGFWRIVPGVLGSGVAIVFASPIINRVLVARNTSQMRRSFYGFAAFLVFLGSLLILVGLGLLLKYGPEKIPEDTSFFVVAESLFQGNPWIVVMMMVMLLAVVMSTADSFLNSLVVVVIRDLIQPLQKEKKEISLNKFVPIIAFVLGMLATIDALFLKDSTITSIIFLTICVLGIFLVPTLFYALRFKLDKKIFWVSIISFLILSIIFSWLAHKNYIYLGDLETWEKMIFRKKRGVLVLFIIPITFVATLVAHVVMHGGLVFEPKPKKDAYTEMGDVTMKDISVWEFFKNPLHWATEKIVQHGSAPVLIGMFLSFSWMLPEMTSPQPDPRNFAIFFSVRLIGVSLLTGLLLHNRWKHPFKRYFPLYYYVSLLWGLPFSATLYFLYNPNNYTTLMLLIVALVVLMILVDQETFLLLVGIGSLLGIAVARISPAHVAIDTDMMWYASVSIIYTLVISFAFMQFKESWIKNKLTRNKMWGLGYVHDIYEPVSALINGASFIKDLGKSKLKKTTKNGKTEYSVVGMNEQEYQMNFLETLQEMEKSGQILNKLTKAFDDINKTDYILKGHLERGSMVAFAREAIDLLPSTYKDQVQVTLGTKSDFEVDLHSNFFANVLLNLVKNADKHGKATKIEVGCDSVRREFYIRDNGKGIPAYIEPYVFNLYFSTGSTGVGLPFVKEIVETMGGSIRFETSSKGTTFFLHFPTF